MQYTLNELIARLEELRNQYGGDTPVYAYGCGEIKPFHGVDCWVDAYHPVTFENFVVVDHNYWP